MPEVKVLIVDDEADVGAFFCRLLQRKDYDVQVALSGAEADRYVRERSFDVALVDLKLPDADGLTILRKIKNVQPNCEVIIMTGYSTTRTAVKAIQYGAYDYLDKPFEDIDQVERLIESAAASGQNSRKGMLGAGAEWVQIVHEMGFQIGISPVVRRLFDIAYKIAKKDVNVLIQGETGTGKEVLARFIHAASGRSSRPFLAVNCGALPENLLESELFGHEKGAFTGASNMRRGIFEIADRGTLFLDEIGEATLAIQVKLLRVLETGEFLRVGGEKPIKTDVRVIAATNKDLERALINRTFREDLFYRLDVVRLELPPLRERREDIPVLVEYFVRKVNPNLLVSLEAMNYLCAYPWPGNIRELANTVTQMAVLCEDRIILPKHLSAKIVSERRAGMKSFFAGEGALDGQFSRQADDAQGDDPNPGTTISLSILNHGLAYYSSRQEALDRAGNEELVALWDLAGRFKENLLDVMRKRGLLTAQPPSLEEVEARAICETLCYYQGNIAMAARSLGIGRNTLYRKIKEYNIKVQH